MSSTGRARTRWIGFSVAAALVAVVLLTGWGLFLAITQGNEIERFLYYGARANLERRIEDVEGDLAAIEAELLETIERAAVSGPDTIAQLGRVLPGLRDRYQLLARPFVLSEDFGYVYPPVDVRSGEVSSPVTLAQSPPESFRRALQLLWTHAPEADTRRALEAVHGAPEIASPWRLRALAALASLDLCVGREQEAAERYRKIFEEFPSELSKTSCEPTRLQLTLARAEALRRSSRPGEAINLLIDTLRDLVESRIGPVSISEERYFVHRVDAFLEHASARQRAVFEELRRLREEREQLVRQRDAVADWRAIPGQIEVSVEQVSVDDPPGRFVRAIGGEPRIVIWRPGGTAPFAAIGFLANTEGLRRTIDDLLGRESSRPAEFYLETISSVAQRSEDDRAADLPKVSLPGALGVFSVRVERPAWDSRIRVARRPYRIAAALIPTLGVGMSLALVMFLVSFRRERHLSRMKTDFVANVSHELKTPLALIRLFGETLSLGRVKDTEKKNEYYEIITRESERLTHLINNVLDFASIEADRKSYDLFPIDVGAVVEETLRIYEFHLTEKGFTLRRDIEDGLPQCRADGNAISQAVINLLNNAVKYSKDHKEISVTVKRAGSEVTIAVQDRGVGIPAEDLRKIFDDFYRSKATSELGQRGSGLGLSLVQHIMKSHGGHVDVESRPGRGSTFTLALPAAVRDPQSKDQAT